MVREDFPEPETPVTTMSRFRGISTSTFFRLWTLAPRIRILSAEITVCRFPDFFSIMTGFMIRHTNVTPCKALISLKIINISLAINNTSRGYNSLDFSQKILFLDSNIQNMKNPKHIPPIA